MSPDRDAELRRLVARAAGLASLAATYADIDPNEGGWFDRVPVMTREKATVAAREAYARRDASSGPAYLFTSGGSTSEPQLAWIPAGLHLDEITSHWQPLRGTDTVANLAMPGRLWSAHVFYNRLAERAGAGVIGLGHVDDAELVDWLGFLDAAGATVLVGTPGQLAAVLRHCVDSQHPLGRRLRAAIWFGEACGPELFELIATHLPGLELHGNYGSTETWVIGHNGPDCDPDAFHVLPHQHVELADGAVLVSTLHPQAVGPVVRYRLGDRGCWVRCRCGREGALRVLGREGALVKFAGTLVDPYALVRAACTTPGVQAAQGVLMENGSGHIDVLQLRIVAHPRPDPDVLRDHVLDAHIDLRFGLRGHEDAVQIQFVDRLETVARTAKTPALVRRQAKP
ncbi:MAG TPA: AMP-binding protein [Pseudonocardia sp.]|nr:AMP-binding protein [Pseudonocardia sp.]